MVDPFDLSSFLWRQPSGPPSLPWRRLSSYLSFCRHCSAQSNAGVGRFCNSDSASWRQFMLAVGEYSHSSRRGGDVPSRPPILRRGVGGREGEAKQPYRVHLAVRSAARSRSIKSDTEVVRRNQTPGSPPDEYSPDRIVPILHHAVSYARLQNARRR